MYEVGMALIVADACDDQSDDTSVQVLVEPSVVVLVLDLSLYFDPIL